MLFGRDGAVVCISEFSHSVMCPKVVFVDRSLASLKNYAVSTLYSIDDDIYFVTLYDTVLSAPVCYPIILQLNYCTYILFPNRLSTPPSEMVFLNVYTVYFAAEFSVNQTS